MEQKKKAIGRKGVQAGLSIVALLGLLGLWWWLRKQRGSISLELRWYDLWTGWYIRPIKNGETQFHLYWCPIWCVAIHIIWPLTASTTQKDSCMTRWFDTFIVGEQLEAQTSR